MRRALTTAGLVSAAIALGPGDASAQAPVDCVTRSGAYAPGANCRVLDVDGDPRRFIVYVPERAAPARGRPLVFMFHGTSGDGAQFLRISGWREQADATGLVAVFPTGLRYRMLESGRRVTKWNDGGLAELIDPAGRPPADDVGFVDAILATPAIAGTLGTLLRSLGLTREPTQVRRFEHATRLRWSGAAGEELQFTMLAGVTHQFPNDHNNPARFEAAAHFARFFAAHPLPVR